MRQNSDGGRGETGWVLASPFPSGVAGGGYTLYSAAGVGEVRMDGGIEAVMFCHVVLNGPNLIFEEDG